MPILLAILAGLCWGVGEVFTRSVLHSHQVGPLTAIAIRSTVALPLLWLAWAAGSGVIAAPPLGLRGEPSILDADRGTVAKLVLGSGVIAGAVAMICFYGALSLGEISRVKPVAFALAPATAVVLGWLVLGEEMTWRKASAVALILAGVVLLTGGGATGGARGGGARGGSERSMERSTKPGTSEPSGAASSAPGAAPLHAQHRLPPASGRPVDDAVGRRSAAGPTS